MPRFCTCDGVCRGKEGLGAGWVCVKESPVAPLHREMDKFDIGKEFSAGFVAALTPQPIDPVASMHWQAGYAAGCSLRTEKGARLNSYLETIGVEKMHTAKPA